MSKLELQSAGIKIEGRWLVRNASVSFSPGKLTALVGPNGSGKSTLLRLSAGLWQPTEGTVTLDKHDLISIGHRDLARRIAFVPQDTHLAFAFTVRDVIAMGRHPHLGRFERETSHDRKCVEEAMLRSDVGHLANRRVTELSGGERQRVIIARSLATEANTILLDEPTANLDIAHTLDVLNLCRELADEGKTVAIALHDLNAAIRYTTQAVLMSAGNIVASGNPAEVFTDSVVRNVFNVNTQRTTITNGTTMLFFDRPSI